MVLTWLPPEDTGLGRDLSYKVYYLDVNGTSSNMTTTTTYFHVTGLSPNTTYTMTVMADNGISGNEENRSVSVNVTTKATSDTITTGTVYYVNVVMCIAVQYGTVSAKIAPRLKCYNNASRMNRYNFPTDNAIGFLFSTLHSEMV